MRVYILLYGVVYCLTFFVLLRQRKSHNRLELSVLFCFISLLLLSLFPVWSGDYHHIAEQYASLAKGITSNIESVYVYAAQYITKDYYQFRLLFWGSGFLLIVGTYKRLNLRMNIALLYFSAVSLFIYSYARVSIGMALMFYGLSLIAAPKKKTRFFSFILGLLFIGSSFFFHKSALFGIAMALLSLVFFQSNKKVLLLLLMVYIFLITVMGDYLTQYLLLDDDMSLLSVDTAQRYLDASDSVRGIGQRIQSLLTRANYYIVLFIIVKVIVNGTYSSFPSDIKVFSFATLLVVTCASIFVFDLGYNTSVLYYRFLNFAIIPMVVVLSYCLSNNIERKLALISLYLGFISCLYALSYSFYLS